MKAVILFLCWFFPSLVFAQSILFENDFFAAGNKDRFLTNHTIISYESVSIGSEMYTPQDKGEAGLPKDDRPWDGYTYVELKKEMPVSKNEARIYRYRLGGVGPLSGAKHIQTFVHDDLGLGVHPCGWGTANPSEVAADFLYEHKFNSRFDSWIGTNDLLQSYGARLGNVRVSGWLEQEARRGVFDKWDFSIFVFGNMKGEAVAYNTHLDGRLFRSDIYTVERVPFVASTEIGFGLEYQDYFFRYGYKYQTEEFKGQDGRHCLGSLEFGTVF